MLIHVPSAQETLNDLVARIEAEPGYKRPLAFGLGVGSVDATGTVTDAWYPYPNYREHYDIAAVLAHAIGYKNGHHSERLPLDLFEELFTAIEPHRQEVEEEVNMATYEDVLTVLRADEEYRKRPQADLTRLRGLVCFIPEDDKGPQDRIDAIFRLHLMVYRKATWREIQGHRIASIMPEII